MKYIIKQKIISQSGQVLPLYALIVSTMVMLWAFVINTGEIVAHKIKVQTAADLGAYAGASVMAWHMANSDDAFIGPVSDSIAELNEYLKYEYYNLVANVSLAQCTTSGVSGRGVNCSYFDSNGVYCDDLGAIAQFVQIKKAFEYYETVVVPQVEARFAQVIAKAEELAKKKVVETIKKNMPNISENEVFIEMKDLTNDFTFISKEVTPSYYAYVRAPPFQTCYYEPFARTLSARSVKYQIGIEPTFSGHVLVGILQKNYTNGVSREGRNADYKPSGSYVNWKKTFGKHGFPAFTAFSAAAPIRNLDTMRQDYEDFLYGDPAIVTKAIDYLRKIEPANVNASHVQENLTLPNEDYYYHESLIFAAPALAVWFIPLAQETFVREELEGGIENKYYGGDNPFKGELSNALFKHDFNLGVGTPKPGFPAMHREAFRNRLQDAQDAYKLFLH